MIAVSIYSSSGSEISPNHRVIFGAFQFAAVTFFGCVFFLLFA